MTEPEIIKVVDKSAIERLRPALDSMAKTLSTHSDYLLRLVNNTASELKFLKAKDIEAKEDAKRKNQLKDIEQEKDKEPQEIVVKTGDVEAGGFSFTGFLAPLFGSITGLSAAITGLGLAIGGIRGWEASAIVRVSKNVARLADTIIDGTKALTGSILARLGITAKGYLRAPRILNQVRSLVSPITASIAALRIRTFSKLGLTSTGALPKTFSNILKTGSTTFEKVFGAVSKMVSGVGKFLSGGGAKLLDPVLKTAKTFTKALGPIGWILGGVFSAIDGFKAFKDKDGNLFEKIYAGLSSAISDFIGAPLDLLKGGIAWIVDKMFGGKDGKTSAGEWLRGFSFENTLNSLFKGIFDIFSFGISWVQDLFTEPVATIQKAWNGYTGLVTDIGQWVFDNTIGPVWDWISAKFDEKSNSLNTWFMGLISPWSTIGEWIYNETIGPVWDWIKDTFSDVVEDIKKWFKDIFSFLPSGDDIKKRLGELLPDWLKRDNKEPIIIEDVPLITKRPGYTPPIRAPRLEPSSQSKEIPEVDLSVDIISQMAGSVDSGKPNVEISRITSRIMQQTDHITESSSEGIASHVIVKGGDSSVVGGTTINRGGDTYITNAAPLNLELVTSRQLAN